jgi:hemerythrin superfamily protein
MTNLVNKLSPSILSMIRMDHTHVMATFHQYMLSSSPSKKRAIVDNICLAVSMHAQLEEELFYPEMRKVSHDSDVLDKSVPEHNEMRQIMDRLKGADPKSKGYDQAVMALMREIMHHVADEETTLLPEAEKYISEERLSELGAEWTRRRVRMAKPYAGEIAINTAKTFSTGTMVALAGTALAIGYMFNQRSSHHQHGAHSMRH